MCQDHAQYCSPLSGNEWIMMTSSNGNIFRVTGPLCEEFTGRRWIPSQRLYRGALMFSFICAWINGWINSRDAVDLRRHRAHYDVILMIWLISSWYKRAYHTGRVFDKLLSNDDVNFEYCSMRSCLGRTAISSDDVFTSNYVNHRH